MSLFSDLLDSTPVVGHFKGLCYYISGDKDSAKQAWWQSTIAVAIPLGLYLITSFISVVLLISYTLGIYKLAVSISKINPSNSLERKLLLASLVGLIVLVLLIIMELGIRYLVAIIVGFVIGVLFCSKKAGIRSIIRSIGSIIVGILIDVLFSSEAVAKVVGRVAEYVAKAAVKSTAKNDTQIIDMQTAIVLNLVANGSFPCDGNLTLFEFTKEYLASEAKRLNLDPRFANEDFSIQKSQIMDEIDTNSNTAVAQIYRQIERQVQSSLQQEPISPFFRDMPAAVYHCYKHCQTPDGQLLSVADYMNLIRRLLKRVNELPEFEEFLKNKTGEFKYEVYKKAHGRRIRIVWKFYDGKLVLASMFMVDNIFDTDEEGHEFINDKSRDTK